MISFKGITKVGPFWKQIQDGRKTTTIRSYRKDGKPHVIVGTTTTLYWKVRTAIKKKEIHFIGTAKVISYREIQLLDIWFDEEAAKRDGFEDLNEFRAWFLTANQLPEWDEFPRAFKNMIESNFDSLYKFNYSRRVDRKLLDEALTLLTEPMALISFELIKDEESNTRDN